MKEKLNFNTLLRNRHVYVVMYALLYRECDNICGRMWMYILRRSLPHTSNQLCHYFVVNVKIVLTV